MSARVAIVGALAGVCATFLAALALHGSTLEAVKLVAAAGGAALGAGLVGAAFLVATRRRPIATQSLFVALTPIGAVAAGAMAASHTVMLSAHPIAALGVVLTSSGTVAIFISVLLGSRLRAGSNRLIIAAREIGTGNLRTTVGRPAVGELAMLAVELETMQSRLEQSMQRERELEVARRELVAWISHDLRTPLARIRAIVEALDDGVLAQPDEVADCHARLRAEAERLGTLVNDLFELNRISAGELVLEFETIEVSELVSDVVASFALLAQTNGLALRAHPPAFTADVHASARHLERALGNLLDNALRYSGSGGAVDVALLSHPRGVAVTIADSCGGIAPGHLSTLLAARNGSRGGANGLGIAIAQGLVEAHGGVVEATTTARGCSFSIALPTVEFRPA